MSNELLLTQHLQGSSVIEIRAPKNIKAVADLTANRLVLTNGSKDLVSSSLSESDIVTASNTKTFTNKTFDANGTGNSISNLEVADFASSVVVTSVGSGSTDTELATAQAVYEAQVAAQTYADGLVVGLWDDRGNFDASGNAFPSTGGSGSAGAILKGDIWTISVAGTLGGHAVAAGDTVRALVDTPGTTDSNWAIGENNIGYVPENSANKSDDISADTGSTTKYPTVNAVETFVAAEIAAIPTVDAPVTVAFNDTTDWDGTDLVILAATHGLGTKVIAEFFKDGASSSFDSVNVSYNVSSSGNITLTVVDTLQFAGKVVVSKAPTV